MTALQLQDAVNSVLIEIEGKNLDNEKRVLNYTTKVTDCFNAAKDSKMLGSKYRNDEKYIENDQLTEAFIKKELDRADARIAAHKRLSMAATHIDEILEETRIRTEYYFDCLKKGSLIYIIGILFTLSFAVPYAIVQKQLFNVIHGWLFYSVSIALFLLSFSLGYVTFRRIFKSRIIKEIHMLCDKFASTQIEKQRCLEEYARLIRSDIPLSFCLTLYQNEFRTYLKRKKFIPEFITYHTKMLGKYIRYIDNVLNELAITGLSKEPELIGKYSSKIVLDKDRFQNNTVYSLIDESIANSLFDMGDKGDINND